jgi:hypothetical protein
LSLVGILTNIYFFYKRNFSLGRFLYNNYVQALSIIEDFVPEVENFKRFRGFKDEDFEAWREEELQYLLNLASEPEYDVQAMAYVEALIALSQAECVVSFSQFYIATDSLP